MADFTIDCVNAPLIKDVIAALSNDQKVIIDKNKHGRWQARKPGFFHRLKHLRDVKHHDEQISRIATVVTKILQENPRLDLLAADNDPNIGIARTFLRKIRRSTLKDPRIAECRRQYISAKLGITVKVFDANPGFEQFAAESYVERYLMGYKHSLKIDPQTQKIEILKDAVIQPWDTVWKEFKKLPKYEGQPRQPWYYGPKGVQREDMYDWKELKPFMKGDPKEWGKQYIFEYCACCTHSPRFNGDHSWIRLKTPEGDIYSVGLYRPGKPGRFDNFKKPFRVKEGYLMQPDVSEFWPGDIFTIPIAITKEQFLQMKKKIETDKLQDKQVFQIFQRNCVLFCHEIASIAGIKLPTAENVLRLLTSAKTQHVADKTMSAMPPFLVRFFLRLQAFHVNLLQLFLGAAVVDAKVKRKFNGKIRPHITSPWDIFKVSKSQLNHPYTLAFKTRTMVMEWRQKEIQKLDDLMKNVHNSAEVKRLKKTIKKIRFDLPAQCRT